MPNSISNSTQQASQIIANAYQRIAGQVMNASQASTPSLAQREKEKDEFYYKVFFGYAMATAAIAAISFIALVIFYYCNKYSTDHSHDNRNSSVTTRETVTMNDYTITSRISQANTEPTESTALNVSKETCP